MEVVEDVHTHDIRVIQCLYTYFTFTYMLFESVFSLV